MCLWTVTFQVVIKILYHGKLLHALLINLNLNLIYNSINIHLILAEFPVIFFRISAL